MIVARILGPSHSRELIVAIGLAEIAMAAWVLSALYRRTCAALQIGLVMTMNILEFFLAPDLLLHGRANIIWAAAFCVALYLGNFVLPRKTLEQSPAG